MNLGFFKEWRKELREDRKNAPVETFCSVVAAQLFRLVCNGCLLANSLLLDVTHSDNCCNSIGFMENL